MAAYQGAGQGIAVANGTAALRAEGIPAHTGYPLPLYKQPVFAEKRFGPYMGHRGARAEIDYAPWSCPNGQTLCYRQECWIGHPALLGSPADMDDIAAGLASVFEHRREPAGGKAPAGV